MHMSRLKYRYLIPALACLALLVPGIASARVRVGIGFGTVIGPRYPYYSYGWYGWPHYHYWYDPWWEPWPVVVAPPVVVRERHVVVNEHRPAPPRPRAERVEKAEPLSEKQQQRRSELLRMLKIGDAASRVQAVQGLEPFARDDKVRTTLEQALLKDRDPQVRRTVAELFSRLRDSRTLPALRQAYTEDESRDVRQAAYRAIIMMEGYGGA
jgi:hypothetical protein